MILSHLADTDVCIQLLKKKNIALAQRFRDLQDGFAISDVTVFELYAGAENYADKSRRCGVIEEFLSLLQVVPLDTKAARLAGAIQGQLSRQGQRIGAYDVLNAGIAISRNLTLATNNIREFKRVTN